MREDELERAIDAQWAMSLWPLAERGVPLADFEGEHGNINGDCCKGGTNGNVVREQGPARGPDRVLVGQRTRTRRGRGNVRVQRPLRPRRGTDTERRTEHA